MAECNLQNCGVMRVLSAFIFKMIKHEEKSPSTRCLFAEDIVKLCVEKV